VKRARRPLALAVLLMGALGVLLTRASGVAAPTTVPRFAEVTPGRALDFPADFGSHPAFRTEWWYLTGWLSTRGGEELGFQITFFRTKPASSDENPSSFAARQLLIAHCAISDPKHGRLWQDQRIRRAGMGLAQAAVGDTDIRIDRWTLKRAGRAYAARIDGEELSLRLNLAATQPPMPNGSDGVSRKGPAPHSASYYYSLPHLKVEGTIRRGGSADAVDGEAWMDHEWSSEYLDDQAIGWDWIGINLTDGGALMAFRIRGSHGDVRWAGGTLRSADGVTQVLSPAEVRFVPKRTWISSRSGTAYPVQWQVQLGARQLDLEPLMDDQENDTRLTTGAIYWEGAVRAYEQKRLIGRGYLELTGYGVPLRLR
jgi:predicted secreted hydrolase